MLKIKLIFFSKLHMHIQDYIRSNTFDWWAIKYLNFYYGYKKVISGKFALFQIKYLLSLSVRSAWIKVAHIVIY